MRSSVAPGLESLSAYQARWLHRDLVAGLVLTALLVPQGMAYAELAGLPAITGLYTSILCLVGYALFGPSKVLVLGPDSSLGPMIAATVLLRSRIDRYGLFRADDDVRFFPTITQAVKAFQAETGASWQAPETPPDQG